MRLTGFTLRDRRITGSAMNKGHRTRQAHVPTAMFSVANMLIPISSGVQEALLHSTSPWAYRRVPSSSSQRGSHIGPFFHAMW